MRHENAPELVSDSLKFKTFPGGVCRLSKWCA